MSVPPNSERQLTLKTGGWVLLLAVLVSIALIVWAIAPAFLTERPPGDGRDPDTYGFDLTDLIVPRETLVPIMRHRDMVPVMHDPAIIDAAEVRRINEEERGKYIVSRDRIVGVEIDGHARAYPITLLTVHEVIHDEIAGVPIAVTYNWLSDSVRVFDRRMNGDVLDLGISGLASNANGLLYDKTSKGQDVESSKGTADNGRVATRPRQDIGSESLWSQLTGIAVAGPAADARARLRTIPAQLVSWSQWLELHPETTVIQRDPQLLKRYRRGLPDDYFRSPLLPPYPVDPVPEQHEQLKWKDRVMVIHTGEEEARRVYPLSLIRERGEPIHASDDDEVRRWTWTDDLDGVELRFIYDANSNTAAVLSDHPIDITRCFWFAWYAAERTLLLY